MEEYVVLEALVSKLNQKQCQSWIDELNQTSEPERVEGYSLGALYQAILAYHIEKSNIIPSHQQQLLKSIETKLGTKTVKEALGEVEEHFCKRIRCAPSVNNVNDFMESVQKERRFISDFKECHPVDIKRYAAEIKDGLRSGIANKSLQEIKTSVVSKYTLRKMVDVLTSDLKDAMEEFCKSIEPSFQLEATNIPATPPRLRAQVDHNHFGINSPMPK